MAKLHFIKKIKKKKEDSSEDTTKESRGSLDRNEKKALRKNKRKETFSKIWEKAGDSIDFADETIVETEEVLEAGVDGILTVGAAVINFCDRAIAIGEWFVLKTLVVIGRKQHQLGLKTAEYKGYLIKNSLVLGAACLLMVGAFAATTGYEYSYNGRPLGIVKEQKDVLEILELASEELSQEYGSNIVIDSETDIKFRPVVSYGKEIDTEDTVLRRLTYMSEINAQGSAILINGEVKLVVENQQTAEQVLKDIEAMFLTDTDSTEYEYVGFVEDIKIEPYSTKLNNIISKEAAIELLGNGGQQSSEYIVASGDTIYAICEKVGLSLSELTALNPGLSANSTIHAGDAIKVQKEIPLLTLETIGVSTFAESIPFETEYKDSSYYYQGESVTNREGQNGKASITARLTKHNGQIVAREDLSREVLTAPVNKVILKGTKVVPPKKGTGQYIRPVNVGISSRYGWRWGRRHTGDDYGAPTGTPIKAADGGTVSKAGWHYGYGLTVIIDHGGGAKTLYGHCSKLYVGVGEKVFQGQTIAAVGNTGNSYGSHCHFEIIINGNYVDPSRYT